MKDKIVFVLIIIFLILVTLASLTSATIFVISLTIGNNLAAIGWGEAFLFSGLICSIGWLIYLGLVKMEKENDNE